MGRTSYRVSLDQVLNLWFLQQGLVEPRRGKLTRKAFVSHLERTGGLQLDTVNAVDRAHYLTLWSRFGPYDRKKVDRWVYGDRVAYEHWGHEASILPASRLPLSKRGMRRFKPRGDWWAGRAPSTASIRRVMKRLREEGPLESADFERDPKGSGPWWGWKEDKASLEILWHGGRVATHGRRHFRRLYDIAQRVYPEGPVGSSAQYEDGWLLTGLSGNGVASEKHLSNYWTAPRLTAAGKKKVVARNMKAKRVVEVEVEGRKGRFLALPEHLEGISRAPAPRGTTLICPFDSLMWHRDRAEEWLGFRYRIEIYTPKAKRKYGYYVMPILHGGRLVGRLDPKLHRDREELEIKAVFLEPGFRRDGAFDRGLSESLRSLGEFLGASRIVLPKGWHDLL
ncbi:MAG: winged helix-turn-helix domain-containing protein [Planctomycetota bacterium]|jgi:uncharacterized protein YcaQ